MPWLDEELERWEELSEEERQRVRELLGDLGIELPDDEDPDYFEAATRARGRRPARTSARPRSR